MDSWNKNILEQPIDTTRVTTLDCMYNIYSVNAWAPYILSVNGEQMCTVLAIDINFGTISLS